VHTIKHRVFSIIGTGHGNLNNDLKQSLELSSMAMFHQGWVPSHSGGGLKEQESR
jgi:hypothetical protein